MTTGRSPGLGEILERWVVIVGMVAVALTGGVNVVSQQEAKARGRTVMMRLSEFRERVHFMESMTVSVLGFRSNPDPSAVRRDYRLAEVEAGQILGEIEPQLSRDTERRLIRDAFRVYAESADRAIATLPPVPPREPRPTPGDLFHPRFLDLHRALERAQAEELRASAAGEAVADLTSLLTLVLTVGAGGTLLALQGRRRKERDLASVERRTRAADEERLVSLVRNSSEIIGVFGGDGLLAYVSPSVFAIAGHRPDDLVGTDPFTLRRPLIHPEDVPVARRVLADAAQRKGPTPPVSIRIRHDDGHWIPMEAVASNLLDDPAIRGIVVNARDRSAEQLLEEELRQAQRLDAMGRLAAGVAHDFNSMLTAVIGRAQLLRRRLSPGDHLRHDAEEIEKVAGRAAALTHQLLAFSRIQVLHPVRLDLNAVVGETRNLLALTLGEDIRIETALDPDTWAIRADLGQLEQVLVNLALNARDAMPEGGTFRIVTENVRCPDECPTPCPEEFRGPYVRLSVSDTGTGMDEETRRRIFEPFFTTKGGRKGAGLGLSVVYGIVAQSGGRIEVLSPPGEGTTFRVCLPLAAGMAEPLPREPAEPLRLAA